MIVKLYKPNPRNTGCAFSCDLGSVVQTGEPCVYVRAVRQYSWDQSKRTGSFAKNAKNPETSVSIKLNETEIGGLINAIENYTEFSAYHSFEDNKTQISFKPWERDGRPNAFSFGIVRNSTNKFGIGVEMSEAYCLLEFFRFSLQELYAYRFNKNEELRSRS